MIKRYLSSVMIVTSAFTIVIGQTPEAKKESLLPPQEFAFSFNSDGGYLGVQTVEVTKDNLAKYNLRTVRGVAVEKVMENSPAAAAGIKEGDVIVRFNGDEITSTRKLTRLIAEVEPDHQVRLTVARGGSEQEITATVGKRQTPKFGEGNFNFPEPGMFEKFDLERLRGLPQMKDFPMRKELPQMKDFPNAEGFKSFNFPNGEGKTFTWTSVSGRQIGVGVTALTKQLARHFGVDGGLMISEVRENSPAAKAGLKAGDIIIAANGKAVKNDFDLIREVSANKDGDVSLTFVRDGKRQTISVTPETSKDGAFFFHNEDDSPGHIIMPPATPRTPSAPAAPRAPNTLFRRGRII